MNGADQGINGRSQDAESDPDVSPGRATPSQPYAVPTYKAEPGQVWYHFLHGNVPNHEIDFMYRPVVPQGPLTRTHFGHLARLMKYIEPHASKEFAFTIGNLSRDDTAREPGRGGVGLIFGFRIRGVTDHAGRRDPPFAHGIAAVDRRMDYGALMSVMMAFSQLLFGKGEYDNPSSVLYREYVRYALTKPSVLDVVLKAYVGDFEGLPAPEKTNLALRFRAGDKHQPKRILIVHDNDVEFSDLAECAARIAAVLYTSDVRWTSITTGRDAEVPGGVVVRFVPKESAAFSGGIQGDSSTVVMSLDDVPFNEAELAETMFGALPAAEAEARGLRRGYETNREALVEPPPEFQASTRLSPEEIRAAIGLATGGEAGAPAGPINMPAMGPSESMRGDSESAASVGVWIGVGLGGVFAIVLVILLVMGLGGKSAEKNEEPATGGSAAALPTGAAIPTAKTSAPASAPSRPVADGPKLDGGIIVFDPDHAIPAATGTNKRTPIKKPTKPGKPPKCDPFNSTTLNECK